MDAVKFIEECRRMYTLGCIKKGINDYNTKAEAVVAEVEAWAAAHPRKTRQSVFLEQYPNVVLDRTEQIISIRPCTIDQTVRVEYPCSKDCDECRKAFWTQEVK